MVVSSLFQPVYTAEIQKSKKYSPHKSANGIKGSWTYFIDIPIIILYLTDGEEGFVKHLILQRCLLAGYGCRVFLQPRNRSNRWNGRNGRLVLNGLSNNIGD
jgi:hypothetical protein